MTFELKPETIELVQRAINLALLGKPESNPINPAELTLDSMPNMMQTNATVTTVALTAGMGKERDDRWKARAVFLPTALCLMAIQNNLEAVRTALDHDEKLFRDRLQKATNAAPSEATPEA